MKKASLLILLHTLFSSLIGQNSEPIQSSFLNDSTMVSSLISQSISNFANNKKLIPSLDLQLEEALQICQKTGLIRQEAFIYNLVGKRERQRSNFSSAIKFCSKAVQIAEQLQDEQLLAEYKIMRIKWVWVSMMPCVWQRRSRLLEEAFQRLMDL